MEGAVSRRRRWVGPALFFLAALLGVGLVSWLLGRRTSGTAPAPRYAEPWHGWRDGEVTVGARRLRFERLSERPLVVRIYDFLSDAECEHLKAIVGDRLKPSTVQVVGGAPSDTAPSPQRTSSSAFLRAAEDPVVRDIEQRASKLCAYPLAHFEPLQVLRYQPGQRYSPHHDYFPRASLGRDGQRHATYFLYLSDDAAGGETAFPRLGLKVQPLRNSAVFWYNCDERGHELEDTLHAGLPPRSGEKWGCNIWVRERPTR